MRLRYIFLHKCLRIIYKKKATSKCRLIVAGMGLEPMTFGL